MTNPYVQATADYMNGSNENPFKRNCIDWLDYEMKYQSHLNIELNDIRKDLDNGSD